jgi:hypothetical protein
VAGERFGSRDVLQDLCLYFLLLFLEGWVNGKEKIDRTKRAFGCAVHLKRAAALVNAPPCAGDPGRS